MCKQHTKPCAQCPWRRTSLAGWLGNSTPQEFMFQAESDVRMPCHVHVDYEREDWERQANTVPRCAGHAIFLRNRCKQPHEPGLRAFCATVERDTETVFQWPQEFIEHHSTLKLKG
jgi:hypothetical protein